MNKHYENLKRQAEANPLGALAVATTAIMAATKLMQANTERGNAKTWKKEVERRSMSSRR